MDPPRSPLYPLVSALAESEAFRAFVEDFPAPARVSDSALPLVLATLHETREGALLALLPEDEHARDAAEAVAWYLDPARVALLPSRGVAIGSGLEPPAHLVGERARALDVLAAGGFVAASARALAEALPPGDERPTPIRISVGEEVGLDALVELLALAGYERVDRVEERGQMAVRGGLVDVFPSTGREPLRVELFGDEIEQVRAFSPFTQRALHPVEEAVVYPATERRRDLVEPELAPEPGFDDEDDDAADVRTGPENLVPPVSRPPDLVWQPEDVRRVWEDDELDPLPLDDAAPLDPFPHSQPHRFEAQRPAIAARGLAEAENELAGMLRQGRRVLVAFPHKGEAQRTERLLRKVDADVVEAEVPLPEEAVLRFVVSPARRGFVWRDLGIALLPDVQVFRKRPPRADARLGRALQSFADLRTGDYVVHEDHGIGKLLGFETKEVAGVTRDYLYLAFRGEDRLYVPHEQLPKVSRYIGADAAAPALSKLGGKAWQNLKSRARASVRELAGELLALYAARQQAPGFSFDLNPVRGTITHIDLREVRLDQPIQASVVVHLVGEAEGAQSGGVVSLVQRELNVEALPMDVPDHIDVDITALDIGDVLRLEDVRAPEGVTFLDDPHETVIVSVAMARAFAELEEAEAEAAAEAEAEALAEAGEEGEEGEPAAEAEAEGGEAPEADEE